MTDYFSNLREKWPKTAEEIRRINRLNGSIKVGWEEMGENEDDNLCIAFICDNLAEDQLKLKRIKSGIFWRRGNAIFGK